MKPASRRRVNYNRHCSTDDLQRVLLDFVFGPPRVRIDPLNNEKEVAACLQNIRESLRRLN